jgi:hypothetical protein
MDMWPNHETSGIDLHPRRVPRRLIACAMLMLISLMIKPAIAAPEEDARATFEVVPVYGTVWRQG